MISTVVKSGTNQYHGGLYELFRNEDMEANNFFNNNRGITRPQDRYNQFGGTIGGPVWIPKLYNGRNRTFFFFNYDQTVQRVSSIPINIVPTDAFKQGNFSSASILVYDPLSGTPFAGNIIPASRINSASAKVMNLLPEPNSPGTPDPLNGRSINNYINPQVLSNTAPKYTGRIDESLSAKDRIFGTINALVGECAHGADVQQRAEQQRNWLDQRVRGVVRLDSRDLAHVHRRIPFRLKPVGPVRRL